MQSRPHNVRSLFPLAAIAMLAACVPAPAPVPSTPPPPVVRTAPAPAPEPASAPPAPVAGNWIDAPQTPGDWRYRTTAWGSQAAFGPGTGDPLLLLACDRSAREVRLLRPGTAAQPVPMRVLTETTERYLAAEQSGDAEPYLAVRLRATDPLLDAMALTRGRFAVETAGLPVLYVPAWAEVTRVIEDCR